MAKQDVKDLNWSNLGFTYRDLPYSYNEEFKDGKWQNGGLTTKSTLTFSEAAEELHYGQEVFEGMKAYRRKDGGINLFRPDMNAKRLNNSAERLVMQTYPEDKFVEAVKAVVKANQEFVPPYGSGGSLYIRPFMVGTEPVVGVTASSTYTFHIYATPVGAYIKGLKPMPYVVSEYDRAAHAGTGQAKTAGNYAASLLAGKKAHDAGYAGELYLDPREHKYIDEFSGANFFGIGKDGKFYTPKSESILPSITKKSMLTIAKDLGLDPTETHIDINDLDQFTEAGAMGTAAVVSPVGSLNYKGNKHVFFSETKPGPVTQKLYDTLFGIQEGDVEDKYGWVVPVEL